MYRIKTHWTSVSPPFCPNPPLNGTLTSSVVERALKKSGITSGRAPPWPGYTFKPEGRDLKPFQPVLGTPNASGVAWLLAQHREDLGDKTVSAIRVWDKSGLENQKAGILLGMVVFTEEFGGSG